MRLTDQSQVIGPGQHKVVIVEGILVFYWGRIRQASPLLIISLNPLLRNMFNLKLFVDTDPDTRLAR